MAHTDKNLPKYGVLSPDGGGGYYVHSPTMVQKEAKAGAAATTGSYWVSITAHESRVPKPPK